MLVLCIVLGKILEQSFKNGRTEVSYTTERYTCCSGTVTSAKCEYFKRYDFSVSVIKYRKLKFHSGLLTK